MTGVVFLHRIHRERANRIDAEPLELARCGLGICLGGRAHVGSSGRGKSHSAAISREDAGESKRPRPLMHGVRLPQPRLDSGHMIPRTSLLPPAIAATI